MIAYNNHIKFAPFGRRTLLTSRRLCERRIAMKAGILFTVLVLILHSAYGSEFEAIWKKYEGAWFSIDYPANFTVLPYEKSTTDSNKYDSVKFQSPGKEVEFQVFSPQWSRATGLLNINTEKEIEVKSETKNEDYIVFDRKKQKKDTQDTFKNAIKHTWLTIESKKGEYVRYVYSWKNSVTNSNKVFSLQCINEAQCQKYMEKYKYFKKSLVQYAD